MGERRAQVPKHFHFSDKKWEKLEIKYGSLYFRREANSTGSVEPGRLVALWHPQDFIGIRRSLYHRHLPAIHSHWVGPASARTHDSCCDCHPSSCLPPIKEVEKIFLVAEALPRVTASLVLSQIFSV